MYDDDPYPDYDDYDAFDDWDDEFEEYSDEDLVSEEYHEEDIYQNDPILTREDMSPPVEWRELYMGKGHYEVSNTGKIRVYGKLCAITGGNHKIGTPYRTFPIERNDGTVQNKYVHEIIYEAFYGEPPAGWEVRHNNIVMEGGSIYSNALENLEIYPIL
jgi:hypothetical protein